MGRFNDYALPALAFFTLLGYIGLLILEFSGRGFTIGTISLAFFGFVIFGPLMWFSMKDLWHTPQGMLLMFGAPVCLMAYALWLLAWNGATDTTIALFILCIGWIQLSWRIMLNRRLIKA